MTLSGSGQLDAAAARDVGALSLLDPIVAGWRSDDAAAVVAGGASHRRQARARSARAGLNTSGGSWSHRPPPAARWSPSRRGARTSYVRRRRSLAVRAKRQTACVGCSRDGSVRDRAEIRARVCEQVDARCEEQQPSHGSLRGNQRQEPLAARRRDRHCGILTGREKTIPARLLRGRGPKMPKPADLAVSGLRLHHYSTGTDRCQR